MAVLQESYVRNYAKSYIKTKQFSSHATKDSIRKSALIESAENFSGCETYDIFLSHSFLDKELILGLKLLLEKYNFSVYVDWTEDPQLDRKNVTRKNVELIKERMKTSTSLLYVVTDNSANSKWMPWELGFMDGYTGKVAILPVTNDNNGFKEHEYLSIYPYVDEEKIIDSQISTLWVNDPVNVKCYSQLKKWISTGQLKVHNS
ncbi:MAG: hypothetical protein IJ530_11820 [Treponema sp.]|uniref:hypothetical protein n=1 Tax=Treponema sp. TaxID=166 RepID=UPI0025EFE3C9|nr:hypothetical protein [Treponema sp.]MBQ8680432.1 hypothetical protein [Treponema sp.]